MKEFCKQMIQIKQRHANKKIFSFRVVGTEAVGPLLDETFTQKVNVWAAIIGDHIIEPFFFNQNLNSTNYLAFIQNQLIQQW